MKGHGVHTLRSVINMMTRFEILKEFMTEHKGFVPRTSLIKKKNFWYGTVFIPQQQN